MISPEQVKKHTVKIVEYVNNFFPHEAANKSERGRIDIYPDDLMLKILVILKLNNVSYRGAASFFMDNLEYMDLLGIKILPSFQTLSRREKELPYWAFH
ncbi:MAG: transposase [Sulfolobaceae archaeon]